MQALTSHLATHLLLIHMVLGCCFHHGHACQRDDCQVPATKLGAAASLERGGNGRARVCCGHGAGIREADQSVNLAVHLPRDHEAPHQHQCEGAHCRFVAVQRTAEQDRPSNIPPHLLDLALVSGCDDAIDKTIVDRTGLAHAAVGFSPNADLRGRVLLI